MTGRDRVETGTVRMLPPRDRPDAFGEAIRSFLGGPG